MLKLSSQQKQQLNETYNLLPERGANNRLLSQAMRRLRSHRAVLPPEHTFELFRTADYVQLWIQTEACRYSKAGSCTVCNYWNGRHCPNAVEDLISWDQLPADCHTLLLNTCGSCLDPLELFLEEQDRLFAWIARHSYQKIILETHADTLDLETIQRVCKLFQRQEVFFEFGIESLSEDTLFYCLNKRLPWKSVPEIVEAVHQSGAFCIVNVLLGAPFLSRQEQVEDTLQTIQKLLGQGVDYITLFPVNIKQHTLPCFLHQHQQYDVVCGDMIVEVLTNLTADDLFRIDVAWYGEHQEEETIPPYFCPKCQAELPELIRAYNHGASAPERKCILDRMRHVRCTCLWEPAGIEQTSLYSRLDCGYDLIQKSLLSECEVN
jgi:radical SAM enzyme (TIGR01210 family)